MAVLSENHVDIDMARAGLRAQPLRRFLDRTLVGGLCLTFVFSCFAKLLHPEGAVAEFAALGLPFPALLIWLTISLQLGASFAAVFMRGRVAVLAALLLAAFTAAATVVAHAFWLFEGVARVQQTNIFIEHLVIVFALLLLARLH